MVNAPKFDGYLLYRSSNYLSSWRVRIGEYQCCNNMCIICIMYDMCV